MGFPRQAFAFLCKKVERIRPDTLRILCTPQEDLTAAAADYLGLSAANGNGLHGAAGRAAEITLLRAVAQAIADALAAAAPEAEKPPSHAASLGVLRKIRVK